MKLKKIGLIILLIVILIAIGFVIIKSSSKAEKVYASNETKQTNTVKTSNKQNDKIIMKDNYFITQINDFYYNFDKYKGKTIEIEGFPLTFEGYTFVARYGLGCCNNDVYAYMEYHYNEKLDLSDEKDWIKVIGTIEKGIDNGEEYIYINAQTVTKMDTRGQERVVN